MQSYRGVRVLAFSISLVAAASAPFACSLDASGIAVTTTSVFSAASSGSSSMPSGAGGAGASGSAASSSGSSGAGPMIDLCGQGSTIDFKDDFNDNSTNAKWILFADSSVTTDEVNQHLVITSTGANDRWGGYYWSQNGQTKRSLVGCYAFIEVPQVLSQSASAEVFFTVKFDQDNQLRFVQIGGKLSAEYVNGGKILDQKTLTYDGVAHRWWRIRESGKNITWDTAPDGKAWTNWQTVTTPGFASSVSLTFGAGSTVQFNGGGTAIFDNLNVPPP